MRWLLRLLVNVRFAGCEGGCHVESADYEPEDSRRPEFRRGFAHGTQAVFDVVGGHLTEEHADLLRHWLNEAVRDWRQRPGEPEEPPAAPLLLPPD